MELKPATCHAFYEWLRAETWNPNQQPPAQFNHFIRHYAQEHGYTINEPELLAEIQECQAELFPNVPLPLEANIRVRLQLMMELLGFAHQGR